MHGLHHCSEAHSRCNVRCSQDEMSGNQYCNVTSPSHLERLHSQLSPPQLPFYIHNSGAFNFTGVGMALRKLAAGQPIDVAFPVGEAQYLVDLHLIPALEQHSLRTYDMNSAELHVIGAMPYASFVLGAATGDESGHETRMLALALALSDLQPFVQRQKAFLLVYGSCSAHVMGIPLLTTLGRGNTIVASTDPMFARDFGGSVNLPPFFVQAYRRGVTLPFFPHSLARERQPGRRSRSKNGFMFHGGLGRYDHGVRAAMLQVLEKVRNRHRGIHVDTATGEMTRGAHRTAYSDTSYQRSGQSYLNASMCFVPSGDVPSSRRLFDVMSAGCVPVLVKSFYRLGQDRHNFITSLPFPRSIPWHKLSIWLGPSVRGNRKNICDVTMSDWLLDWHSEYQCELEEMRRHTRRAFHDHLDLEGNPAGVVWALMRELETRFQSCDRLLQGRHVRDFVSTDDASLCPYNDAAKAAIAPRTSLTATPFYRPGARPLATGFRG